MFGLNNCFNACLEISIIMNNKTWFKFYLTVKWTSKMIWINIDVMYKIEEHITPTLMQNKVLLQAFSAFIF